MPLYFFDTDDGERRFQDDAGMELDGIDAVAREAFELLRDLALVHMPDGTREMTTSVRDVSGAIVYRGVMTVDGRRIPPGIAS